jgi:LacI family transcriptional regulator
MMGNDRNLTIRDIAVKLNLSKSTVSRALRDSYDVNPETRLRVLSLVKELNFEPNVNARGLREQKTFNIGVIIPSFQIPFYSVVVGGIHRVLSEAGFNVMTSQTNETYESELISVNSFLKSRVDGMLISFSANTNQFGHIRKVAERGVPVVMFNRITTDVDLPSVTVDDYKGAYNAIEYLISRGGRNIAYISGPKTPLLSKRRKEGYMDCMKAHGMILREEWIIESDFSVAGGMTAAEKMLKLPHRPDSLFCICDSVAIGAMIALKRRGVRIPDDISVMGFTNDFFSSFVDPPLTTISQPVSEIGEKAAELLLRQQNRKLTKWDTRHIVLDTSLVVRKSTR